jgi:predicted ribosomally synthesized peptide with SipW-like signal peptide
MNRFWSFVAGVALVACVSSASAYFTAQSQVPDNVIRTGTVAVASEPVTSAISAEGLAPGIPETRTLTVRNTGSLPSDVVVTGAKKMGITAFYDAMTVRVLHGDRVVYSGALNALKTAPVALDPGESAALRFEMMLPASAGNTLADTYVRMTLYVDAEQRLP